MHGFVYAQAFDVGPLQYIALLAGISLGIVERSELHEFSLGVGFDLIQQRTQREAHRGNYHRPAFDAAHTIDAVFQMHLQQGVDVEGLRLIDQAFHLDRPRMSVEILGQVRRLVLVRAELVIVVVMRDVVERRLLLRSAERTRGGLKLRTRQDRAWWNENLPDFVAGHCGTGDGSRSEKKFAAIEIQILRGDLRRSYIGGLLDQHLRLLPDPNASVIYLYIRFDSPARISLQTRHLGIFFTVRQGRSISPARGRGQAD